MIFEIDLPGSQKELFLENKVLRQLLFLMAQPGILITGITEAACFVWLGFGIDSCMFQPSWIRDFIACWLGVGALYLQCAVCVLCIRI